MNFLERRALQRSSRRLGIPAEEEVLDFDVGSPFFSVLPPPLPLPPAKAQIDLVCSDKALYVHVAGHAVRLPWSDLLEVRLVETAAGRFVVGRLVSGESFQVSVGRFARPLAQVAADRLATFEMTLTDAERLARQAALSRFNDADRRATERFERLRPLRNKRSPARGYAVVRETKEFIGHGHVEFMDDGLWFHSNGDLALIVPYASLVGFRQETATDGASLLVSSCEMPDVTEVVVQPVQARAWLSMFEQYASPA